MPENNAKENLHQAICCNVQHSPPDMKAHEQIDTEISIFYFFLN